jgi:YVTN family beta-propeller protein
MHTFRVQAVDPRGRRSRFARASVEVLRPTVSVKVGLSPVALTFGANALWTADFDGGPVTRVEGGASRARIPIGGSPGGITLAGGSIWVGDFRPNGVLTRLDPATNGVIGHVVLGGQPSGLLGDGDTLWVADYAGSVVRVDTRTNAVVARIPVGGNPESFALGFGLVWVSNQDGTLTAIDPSTNAVAGAKVVGDRDLDAVGIGPDALWTTSFYGGTLLKVDPASRKVLRRIRLGGQGSGVLVRGGSVWASVSTPACPPRRRRDRTYRAADRVGTGRAVFDGTNIRGSTRARARFRGSHPDRGQSTAFSAAIAPITIVSASKIISSRIPIPPSASLVGTFGGFPESERSSDCSTYSLTRRSMRRASSSGESSCGYVFSAGKSCGASARLSW